MAKRLAGELSDELGALRRQQTDFKRQLDEERKKNAELLDMVGDKATFKYTVDTTLHSDLKRQIKANTAMLAELKRRELELEEAKARVSSHEQQANSAVLRTKELARILQDRNETFKQIESQNGALKDRVDELSSELQQFKAENSKLLDGLKSVKRQYEATSSQKNEAEQVLIEVKREVLAAKHEFTKEKKETQRRQIRQKVLFVADILELFFNSKKKLCLANGFFVLKEFSQRHLLIKKTLLVGFSMMRDKVKAVMHKAVRIWKLNTDRKLLENISKREEACRLMRSAVLQWQSKARKKQGQSHKHRLLLKNIRRMVARHKRQAFGCWRLMTMQGVRLRAVCNNVGWLLRSMKTTAFEGLRQVAAAEIQQEAFEDELTCSQAELRLGHSKYLALLVLASYSKLQKSKKAIEQRVTDLETQLLTSDKTASEYCNCVFDPRSACTFKSVVATCHLCGLSYNGPTAAVLVPFSTVLKSLYKVSLNEGFSRLQRYAVSLARLRLHQAFGLKVLVSTLKRRVQLSQKDGFASLLAAKGLATWSFSLVLHSIFKLSSAFQLRTLSLTLTRWRLTVKSKAYNVLKRDYKAALESQRDYEDTESHVRNLTKRNALLEAETRHLKQQLEMFKTQTIDEGSLVKLLKQLSDEREALAKELASRSFNVKRLLDENQTLGLRLKNAQLEAEQLMLLNHK